MIADAGISPRRAADPEGDVAEGENKKEEGKK